MSNDLKHYGTPRRSGRYPWGSGEHPEERTKSFLGNVAALKKQGLSDKEIAKGFGITVATLRRRRSIELDAQIMANSSEAMRLKSKGMSNTAIGERMGVNESVVRSWLAPGFQDRAKVTTTVANVLKDAVDNKEYIDIGSGVEAQLGISRNQLDASVEKLQQQGYKVEKFQEKQVGTGKNTTYLALSKAETPYIGLADNRYKLSTVYDYSEDGGRSFRPVESPKSIDSSRIQIAYNSPKDGVIELRRGVSDLDLGASRYAQVRVAVDGTGFMKGMAMYSDDIPDGKDVIYNTKKPEGTLPEKVFKPNKTDELSGEVDEENPFGAITRQKHYIDADGKEQLSALNIVGSEKTSNEEGAWSTYSKNISSQVLSKQSPSLAKKQLGLAYDLKSEEFDELNSLTNPAVKQVLLKDFSDGCDSDAVHLKAAALPRQGWHVLLPILSMKPNEVYAPGYENGEPVVLIRHPHGGIFEIPQLIVNNKNPEANRVMKDAKDAVGIHPSVASKLSGADFDGDDVLVIPNKNGQIKIAPSLKALKDFDTVRSYPKYDGMPVMTPRIKQKEMGDISNLITDMTIKGASDDEIARAVKHSMVVIDAEKHELNYKQSAIDNNIAQLKTKYQGGPRAGASTLISRAKSDYRVNQRQDRTTTDPLTGKKIYKETGDTYVVTSPNKRGPKEVNPETGEVKYLTTRSKVMLRQTKSSKMAEYDNAYDLLSEGKGTRIERVYADHANALKALANKARLELDKIEPTPYSPSARETYPDVVDKLRASLKIAYRNKPLERQAQLIANKIVSTKKKSNPNMSPQTLKKTRGMALIEARSRAGAGKQKISITDRDWEAIQAGAFSHSFLKDILLNMDVKSLKERAMPRRSTIMSPARIARVKSMHADGYTRAEIATALGVSATTISNVLEA
jgi:DNA-binding CsgD family transcriptional regulator